MIELISRSAKATLAKAGRKLGAATPPPWLYYPVSRLSDTELCYSYEREVMIARACLVKMRKSEVICEDHHGNQGLEQCTRTSPAMGTTDLYRNDTRCWSLYPGYTSLLLPNKRFALNNCVEICTGVRFEWRNVQGSFMKEVHVSSVLLNIWIYIFRKYSWKMIALNALPS